MTQLKIKQLAQKYKVALVAEKIPVTSLYLFGSYAKGKENSGSDVDFCVVSKAFGKNDFLEMVKVNQIAKLISPDIEAFPVSEEEFDNGSNPFALEASKTGKRIL